MKRKTKFGKFGRLVKKLEKEGFTPEEIKAVCMQRQEKAKRGG